LHSRWHLTSLTFAVLELWTCDHYAWLQYGQFLPFICIRSPFVIQVFSALVPLVLQLTC